MQVERGTGKSMKTLAKVINKRIKFGPLTDMINWLLIVFKLFFLKRLKNYIDSLL